MAVKKKSENKKSEDKNLIEETKPKKKESPPYLKHVPTGRIYPYHPITAERGDMIPYWKKPGEK